MGGEEGRRELSVYNGGKEMNVERRELDMVTDLILNDLLKSGIRRVEATLGNLDVVAYWVGDKMIRVDIKEKK